MRQPGRQPAAEFVGRFGALTGRSMLDMLCLTGEEAGAALDQRRHGRATRRRKESE